MLTREGLISGPVHSSHNGEESRLLSPYGGRGGLSHGGNGILLLFSGDLVLLV
jgi:hypothetical protein